MWKFILLLIFSSLAVAQAPTEIFNGWVASGASFTAEGLTFRAAISSDTNHTAVDLPTGYPIIVPLGDCRDRDFYRVCFNDTDAVGHNYTIDEPIYDVRISIDAFKAAVSMTRTFDVSDPIPGQLVRETLKVISNGVRKPLGFIYEEPLLGPKLILESVGAPCKMRDDKIVLDSELGVSHRLDCSMRWRAKKSGNITSVATMRYFDGTKNITSTDSQTFDVAQANVAITLDVPGVGVRLGDEVRVDARIENVRTDPVSITEFSLEFPSWVDIGERSREFEEKGLKLFWKGTLPVDGVKDYYALVESINAKNTPVKAFVRYNVRGISATVEDEVNISFTKPEVKLDWANTNTVIEEGTSFGQSLKLTNPSAYRLFDVVISIESSNPALNKEILYESIGPQQTYEFFSLDQPWPAGDHVVTIKVAYKTRFAEEFSGEETRTVKVLAKGEPLPEPVEEEVVIEQLAPMVVVDEAKNRVALWLIGTGVSVLLAGAILAPKLAHKRRALKFDLERYRQKQKKPKKVKKGSMSYDELREKLHGKPRIPHTISRHPLIHREK